VQRLILEALFLKNSEIQFLYKFTKYHCNVLSLTCKMTMSAHVSSFTLLKTYFLSPGVSNQLVLMDHHVDSCIWRSLHSCAHPLFHDSFVALVIEEAFVFFVPDSLYVISDFLMLSASCWT